MIRLRPLVLILLFCCHSIQYCKTPSYYRFNDPSKVKFIGYDIDNFWKAFDLSEKTGDSSFVHYESMYFRQASPGLRAFLSLFEMDKESFVKLIRASKSYLKAAKNNTLSGPKFEKIL